MSDETEGATRLSPPILAFGAALLLTNPAFVHYQLLGGAILIKCVLYLPGQKSFSKPRNCKPLAKCKKRVW
jgi:hypothetical protein